jgi:hypothetical protein
MIERIFGVLKRRFRILLLAPEYSLDIQARIPTALCAVHNFIRMHDKEEGQLVENGTSDIIDSDHHDYPQPGGMAEAEDDTDAKIMRNRIAQAMWDDYQCVLTERMVDSDVDEDSDDLVETDSDEYL